MKKINFSPVTRLSGLLSVEVFVDGNVVVDARVKGNQFRGFEWMLVGREITDAPYFTERICGICSMAHGAASSYLLDTLFADDVPVQAQLIRNIMLGLEFLQNHIRHFYAFSLPDYVRLPKRLPYQGEVTDIRVPREANDRLVESYLQSFAVAAKAHEAQTLFGGKAPHPHGMVHGGVTVAPTADKIQHASSIVADISSFIAHHLLPDTRTIARYYQDHFAIGTSARRFISYGLFREKGLTPIRPAGVVTGADFDPRIRREAIKEDITYAYYQQDEEANLDPSELTPPAPKKEDAYTFVKAVHYDGLPYECGPLARMAVAGEFCGQPSTMARVVARSLETKKIAVLINKWLKSLDPGAPILQRNEQPAREEFTSLTDAPRGALLHEAQIDGSKIVRYGIITPTVWNFSPLNSQKKHGPVEESLIGTKISDLDRPVEIGRIVRAFDPCLSCGTHIIRL